MTAPIVFVTSSGTEIGKTYVTVGLIQALRAQGRPVTALKPLITDYTAATAAASDTALILEALGRPLTEDNVAEISPWRYRAALAPDMAAAREGARVPYGDVVAFCRAQQRAAPADGVVIVEGAGGVLVPIDATHTMRDLMRDLAATPILVVGSYLGTISHTLTAAEALSSAGLPPAAVVVSESADVPIPLAETCAVIERFLGAPPWGALPLVALPRGSRAAFTDLATRLMRPRGA